MMSDCVKKMMKHSGGLLVVAMLLAAQSAMGQSTFAQYYEAAKKGDSNAQNQIGLCYDAGDGIAKDPKQAFMWYSKAAAQNNSFGLYNVGVCYYYGKGVALDYAQAALWFRKSADLGLPNAQYNLGLCYLNGQGVAQNQAEGLRWFKKASDQGLSIASYNVGMCYFNGWGCAQDLPQAVNYFQKAADGGHVAAYNNLGVCYKVGKGVPQDLKKAAYWYQKAADMGDAIAQDNLGGCYANGWGVPQDYGQAVYWFEKADANGYAEAKRHAAEARAKQREAQSQQASAQPAPSATNPSTVTAQSNKYQQNIEAAKAGNAKAQSQVAYCYYKGDGVQKDLKQAVYWYTKSAEQGFAPAQGSLALLYDGGEGVEKNPKKAFYWYKKAAEQGNRIAQNGLGYCYSKGKGVEQNDELALYWYQKSADQGNEKAQKNLEILKKRIEQKKNAVVIAVDKNIPTTAEADRNTFAVIIGNEKYDNEADVPYAENDAQVFKEYVLKTLGVPEKQVKFYENATLNNIRSSVRWLSQAMEVMQGKGKVIFYYAGHGIPDESTQAAYLLPTDGTGSDVESAYSLQRLYSELGQMQAQRVMVFLDACFSGSKREGGMMASARGVAIKAKSQAPKGNMVVFTAAQGDETAYPYQEMQHGMFTYYLLKKLQDTKGNATLGELQDYLTSEVKRQSFIENSKMQTPSVSASAAIGQKWRNMRLK